MKNAFYICLLMLSCSSQTFSQTYIKPMLIGWGDPLVDNDDTITFSGFNLPTNETFWSPSSAGNFANGDTNNNFQYYQGVSNTDFTYNRIMLSGHGNTDTNYAFSTVVFPKFNYEIVSYTSPTSVYSQDGEMTIYFDSIVNLTDLKATTICEYFQSNGMDNYYLPGSGQSVKRIGVISTDGHTFTFQNIRLGTLLIEINGGPAYSDYFQAGIYIGNPDEPFVENCGIYTYLAHRLISDPQCNSILILEPQQIEPMGPFTVNYTVTGPSATEFIYYSGNQALNAYTICPGVYKVRMESNDYASRKSYQDYDFVQIDPALTYYDVSVASAYQDSLGLYYKDCNFDFNTPITSIDLDYTNIGTDTYGNTIYDLDFSVMQNSLVTHYYDTLFVVDIETYKIVVGIYCDELKGTNSFIHQGIALVPNEFMSVSSLEKSKFKVQPNPTSDFIEFTEPLSGKICDLSGRIFKNFDNSTMVDVNQLPNGLYFIEFNNSSSNTKFVIHH